MPEFITIRMSVGQARDALNHDLPPEWVGAIREQLQLPPVKPEPEGDDWVMVTFYNDGHYASARTALEIGDDWAKFIEDYPDAEVYRPESKHRPKSAPSNGIFDAVCCGRGFNSAARLSDHLNGGPDD